MTLSSQVRLGGTVSVDLLPILLGVAKECAEVEGQVDLHILASRSGPHNWVPAKAKLLISCQVYDVSSSEPCQNSICDRLCLGLVTLSIVGRPFGKAALCLWIQ